MEDAWAIPAFAFVALCLFISFVGMYISISRDAERDAMDKRRDERLVWLEQKIDQIERDSREKDKKIAMMADEIVHLKRQNIEKDAQIASLRLDNEDKQRQITELRRQMRPGTIS